MHEPQMHYESPACKNEVQGSRRKRRNLPALPLLRKAVGYPQHFLESATDSQRAAHSSHRPLKRTSALSETKVSDTIIKKFINFNDLFSHLDDNFFPGHHFYSREYCECVDGIYLTKHHKLVEYYARMIKDCECPYTTQLVYTSDNKVTAGFGKKVLLK